MKSLDVIIAAAKLLSEDLVHAENGSELERKVIIAHLIKFHEECSSNTATGRDKTGKPPLAAIASADDVRRVVESEVNKSTDYLSNSDEACHLYSFNAPSLVRRIVEQLSQPCPCGCCKDAGRCTCPSYEESERCDCRPCLKVQLAAITTLAERVMPILLSFADSNPIWYEGVSPRIEQDPMGVHALIAELRKGTFALAREAAAGIWQLEIGKPPEDAQEKADFERYTGIILGAIRAALAGQGEERKSGS